MLAAEVRPLRHVQRAGAPGLGDLLRGLVADLFKTESARSLRLRRSASAPRQAVSVVERLAASGVWLGPGDVGVEGDRLVLRGRTTNTAGLATVEAVVHHDDLVWVRRRHAHDWLVACASRADAESLAQSLTRSSRTASAS